MSKGEELGKLLGKGEELHRQMDNLFVKAGVPLLDLKALSQPDMEEWNRLQSLSDEVVKQIGNLMNTNN